MGLNNAAAAVVAKDHVAQSVSKYGGGLGSDLDFEMMEEGFHKRQMRRWANTDAAPAA